MPEVCLVNGRARSVSSASIPIDDWAVRYGWGLFETIRIHKGCPVFLTRHIDRLCSSAPLLELGEDSQEERNVWRRYVRRAVELSRMRDGIVNCYWTRGSMLSKVPASRIVRIRPVPRYPKHPLTLWVAPWRIEPTFPGAGAKTLAYFPNMYAGLAARRSGHDEALVLNTKDRVADGAASSVFVVTGGRIKTPSLDQGTLAGVTRSVVIEIVREMGFRIQECPVSWKSLLAADEIFVTSSLRGVVPVSRISDKWKSKRVNNSITSQLIPGYRQRVAKDITNYQQAP